MCTSAISGSRSMQRARLVLLAVGTAVIGAACTTAPGHFDVSVTIDNPVVNEGFANLVVDVPEDIQVASAELLIDGTRVISVKQARGAYELRTQGNVGDGAHDIGLRVIARDGATGEGEVSVTVANPTVRVTRELFPTFVFPGMAFDLKLEVSGAVASVVADLSALSPAGGNSAELTHVGTSPSGDGQYELTQVLAAGVAQGWKPVPIRVTGTDQRTLRVGDVQVFLGSGPLLPFMTTAGNLEQASLPPPSTGSPSAAAVTHVTAASIVTGGQTMLGIDLTGDVGSSLFIGADGFGGHLVVPLPSPSPNHFDVPLFLLDDRTLTASKGTVNLRIAVGDADGAASPAMNAPLSYGKVAAGALHVGLAWDSPCDVDLHVVTPEGEIYYGHRTAGTGQLDLDSDAGCSIDNVNAENVFWTLPASGEYIVRVDYYKACPSQAPNWTVSVDGCGVTLTANGSFTAAQADRGSAGSGVEALRFRANCPAYRVKGTAQYERINTSGAKLQDSLDGVPVIVVDSASNMLGRGVVQAGGAYSVLYNAPAAGPQDQVHVAFIADDGKVAVQPLVGNDTYVVGAADQWTPMMEPDKTENVILPISAPSGPFGILRTLRKGQDWIAAMNLPLSPIVARWTAGMDPPDGTRYDPNGNQIEVNGGSNDPDEFDDSPLLHELGHRVMETISRDDSSGPANHYICMQIAPADAWSEGFATYFGQRVIGRPSWLDRNSTATYSYLLKPLDAMVPPGTKGGTPQGDLSEAIVAALLWRMQDPIETGDSDELAGLESSWFPAYLKLMKDVANDSAGDPNGADLADLVHLWGCKRSSSTRQKLSTLMKKKFQLLWLTSPGFCP